MSDGTVTATGRSESSPPSRTQRPPPPPATAVTNRRVRRLLDAIPSGGSILDLGCVQHDADRAANDDWIHSHCYRIGDDVLGVDFLDREVDRLARHGYHVRQANVETMALGRRFDTIVAGELLEHLSNVGAMLDRCHDHLHGDGVLVLTTPNPWAFHRFAQALFGDVSCNEEHTCWFDERTLRQVLARHGFAIERIEYVPPAETGVTKCLASLGFDCLGGTSLLVSARKD